MSFSKALCWSVVRNDGTVIRGTNHDVALAVTASGYAGTYDCQAFGISATDVKYGSDLSVDNMEVNGALLSMAVQANDIEAGLYDGAAITIFETDWTNPSSVIVIQAGLIGKITRTFEGAFTCEVQGPQRYLTQNQVIEMVSKTCRASLGDSRCKVVMTPYTFSGSVTGLVSQDQFNDSSLNQAGPTVGFVDQTGSTIPGSYQITVVPPSGGKWVSDAGVSYTDGVGLTLVSGSPAQGQYSVSNGVYSFNSADSGRSVYINYNYTYGFFNDGKLTWTSGANNHYSMEVRLFTPAAGASPALVQLFQPMVNAIAVGDTYTIAAGCNRLLGTCRDRFNNIVNMRAEPYVPGPDSLRRVLT